MAKWEEGRYGITNMRLARGFVQASVSSSVTGESGYVVRVNDSELKKRFENAEDAKRAAESFTRRVLEDALAELQSAGEETK